MNWKYLIAIIACVAVVCSAVAIVVMDDEDDRSRERTKLDTPIVVTDAIGNEVKVNYKVERVALTDFNALEYFAEAYGEGWEELVCLLPEMSSRDSYVENYIFENYPSLKKIDVCPSLFGNDGMPLSSLPMEIILESDPDLILVSGGVASYLDSNTFKSTDELDIPHFYYQFYTSGLNEQTVENNYGQFCKIFDKEERGNAIVTEYISLLTEAKSKIATINDEDRVKFLAEFPTNDLSSFGYIMGMGIPEFELLGSNALSVPYDYQYDISKLTDDNPDWIIVVNSSYFGTEQYLGYFTEMNESGLSELMSTIKGRTGMNTIPAVQNNHVVIMYGELRQTLTDIFDLYSLGHIVYPELFTGEDLQKCVDFINKYLPWNFEGTWAYTGDSTIDNVVNGDA